MSLTEDETKIVTFLFDSTCSVTFFNYYHLIFSYVHPCTFLI